MSRPWILDYDSDNCTIGAALAIVGEKWTFLVLREAFNGVRRFDDIRRRTRAPRQVLSDRLARLVRQGLLREVPYREAGQRARSGDRLTEKGPALFPLIAAPPGGGGTHPVRAGGPPVGLTHPDSR